MRWPQSSDIERIDSRDAVLVLRRGAQLGAPDFKADALDDLLRAALTFGVSALDRYLHERVIKQVVSSLRTSELRTSQERLSIPAVLALKMTDALRQAQRNGRTVRPANQLRVAIQDSLHRRTFQSWREIEEAFELIGVSGVTGKLQTAYGIGDICPIKNQLNNIVQRRHFVVHEGDLVRHQRGGQTRVHLITRKYVADSLDFLDTLVGHLQEVT